MRSVPAKTTVAALPLWTPSTVLSVIRPAGMDPETWRITASRLEELGVFLGVTIEKVGTLGPAGPVILKAMGCKVAVSKDVAGLIIVRHSSRC